MFFIEFDDQQDQTPCENLSLQLGYRSNQVLQIYTIHSPPTKLKGHQNLTPSVAIQHSYEVMMSFH